jgi:pimeloyl-ACP methyl ester carboxylesterase
MSTAIPPNESTPIQPVPEDTDFNIVSVTGLVDIGTAKLHILIDGPPRTKPTDPLIVIIHGTAGSLEQYPALVHALKSTARTLVYSRRGLAHSQTPISPNPPTMDSIAADLDQLLAKTRLQPPYLVIGHSWGGMLGVNWIHSHRPTTTDKSKSRFLGHIILDGGCPSRSPTDPTPYASFASDPGTPWAHATMSAIMRQTPPSTLTAATLPPQLTPTELATLNAATSTESHKSAAQLEFAGLLASYADWQAKEFFPPSSSTPTASPASTKHVFPPLCLVHSDAITEFRAAVAALPEHAPEHHAAETILQSWPERTLANRRGFLALQDHQDQKLELYAEPRTGHNVMITDVDVVLRAVRWVLGFV